MQHDPELSPRQFGVELSRLTSEERAVPLLVEKLINYIEMHGLYTEGIYRKSGSTNKIKELRQGLDTGKRRGGKDPTWGRKSPQQQNWMGGRWNASAFQTLGCARNDFTLAAIIQVTNSWVFWEQSTKKKSF